MKILFFTHYTSLYGANKSLLNLLEGLERYNVTSMVVVPSEGNICEELRSRSIPYVIQDFHWWSFPEKIKNNISFHSRLIRNYKLNRSNKKKLEALTLKLDRFQPEFICSNSSVFDFGFLYSRKIRTPHVWFLRETQEQYNLSWKESRWQRSRKFNQSEIVFAVSDYLKKYFFEKNKIKHIEVLYNGILNRETLLKLDSRINSKDTLPNITFGIVGIINTHKNQEEAVRAMAVVLKKYPNSELIIAGAGNLNKLRELISHLKIEGKVKLLGHVPDPFDAFIKIDILLMCSRMEGMGRVTVEAMACKIPVIGYKEGGTENLIAGGWNGLFYKEGHLELAEKMVCLIENSELRIQLGANGRKFFESQFTSEIYGEKFYSYLSQYRSKIILNRRK